MVLNAYTPDMLLLSNKEPVPLGLLPHTLMLCILEVSSRNNKKTHVALKKSLFAGHNTDRTLVSNVALIAAFIKLDDRSLLIKKS